MRNDNLKTKGETARCPACGRERPVATTGCQTAGGFCYEVSCRECGCLISED